MAAYRYRPPQFTVYCLIHKSTPELCKKLEEMGWKISLGGCPLRENTVCAALSGYYESCSDDRVEYLKGIYSQELIDCGTNEELFLALAAINDNDCEPAYRWYYSYNGEWAQYPYYKEVRGNGEVRTLTEWDFDLWVAKHFTTYFYMADAKEILRHFGHGSQMCRHYRDCDGHCSIDPYTIPPSTELCYCHCRGMDECRQYKPRTDNLLQEL